MPVDVFYVWIKDKAFLKSIISAAFKNVIIKIIKIIFLIRLIKLNDNYITKLIIYS